MTIFVVGATGATGRWLVKHLLDHGLNVKVVVRSAERLPENIKNHANLTVIEASILDIDQATLAEHVKGCDAVASCLGHNLTRKGIWGQPRRLVTDAVRNLCNAIKANNPDNPVKFVLMNTTGNSNRDLSEPLTYAERFALGALRVILPPQVDNEQAADYLRVNIGQNDEAIEWVAVRPDSLIDEESVTEYTLHPSPIRSPLFNAGKTSRINVGHFMAELITDDDLWNTWKGQMPVMYNVEVTN